MKLQWSEIKKYQIKRGVYDVNESLVDFHTRVANEIQTMNCKIIQMYINNEICTIHFMNKLDNDEWVYNEVDEWVYNGADE